MLDPRTREEQILLTKKYCRELREDLANNAVPEFTMEAHMARLNKNRRQIVTFELKSGRDNVTNDLLVEIGELYDKVKELFWADLEKDVKWKEGK